MKLKRVEAGRYVSKDGRVLIEKEISQQTGRTDETCWSITIDGYTLPFSQETKKDAVKAAEKRLQLQKGPLSP